MISSFSMKMPPQIVFGPGKLAALEEMIVRFGSRPLLVLGNRSFLETNSFSLVKKILSKLEFRFQTVHICSEPSPKIIDAIVTDPSHADIDLVIAIGGGSVLDGGKAISAMLAEQTSITRFLEGVGSNSPSGNKLPFIAIPTTSGTGSEATCNAVISSIGKQGFKSSLRHDNYMPNLALVDPALTLSCPKKITVACSLDSFTQLVEGYLSTNSSALTDTMALDGIRAIHRSLRVVCVDGSNIAARTDLSYSALLSGIVLANSGLGTIHGFASVIGGLFAIPHGVVCGTLMAPANALTLKSLRNNANTGNSQAALIKYTKLGQIFSNQKHNTDTWYQDFFIEELERLSSELDVPKLSEYGVRNTDIQDIVDKTGNKYNPVQLNSEELSNILHCRIS